MPRLPLVLPSALVLALSALLALAPLPSAAVDDVQAELVVGSDLTTPLFVTAPPGDDRLFVVERGGRIRIVKSGFVVPTPFLQLSVGTGGEGGLLGLAFPPDYAESGLFYVYYTDTSQDSVVSRFSVSGDPDLALAAETVILTIDQPFANHNGGTIHFGPDGFLWFATGDGGNSNDPAERAQNLNVLLGKMLRLDVGPVFDPTSIPVAGQNYRIPADNPFVGVAGRDEIWALGLRNPYRWSFDRETGDIWIADVGQGQSEEVDFEPAGDPGGRNYGWDVMEGTLCNANDPAPAPPCNDPSLTLPVHEYSHAAGNCSITGGYVNRDGISPITGQYFFGDFCTGRVWTLDADTLALRERTAELGAAGGVGFALVGFGEGGDGTLYMVHQNGSIYRLSAADPACDDGLDNDGDGLIDFPEDPGCMNAVSDLEDPACNDGVDNDGDGLVDLADPGCQGNAFRNRESNMCGLGFEVALALLPLLAWRARRRAR